MTIAIQGRARTILRARLRADVLGLPVAWAAFAVVVVLLAGAVALLRGGLSTSAWEQGAEFTRWYAGAVGVYLTAVYLPLYVTHGFTRREFTLQLPPLVAAFATAYALLMTLGFALETLAYGALGWPQELVRTHLFEAPTQYALVLTEFLLVGLAWVVAGAVLGGAFYRDTGLGVVLVPVALVAVGLVESAAGVRYFGPFPAVALDRLPLLGGAVDGPSTGAAVAVTAGVVVLGLLAVWALVRALPIRSRAA